MAGEARTNAFLLSTATVMVGPQADLLSLNATAHSIGLVKNFQVSAEPSYTELTQGVKNNIVYSVLTQNPVRCSMEVFEMTAKNLAYGLGLDGDSSSYDAITTTHTLKDAIAAAGDSAVIVAVTDLSALYPVGSWVFIQPATGSDVVHLSRVEAVSWSDMDDELTITLETPVPTGVSYAIGAKISKINRINVGSKDEQPYLAAKVVGILPDGNTPCVVMIPKMRIVKGFNLAFQSDNFGNLPFEFTPYELVSTDANYALFTDTGPVAVFAKN